MARAARGGWCCSGRSRASAPFFTRFTSSRPSDRKCEGPWWDCGPHTAPDGVRRRTALRHQILLTALRERKGRPLGAPTQVRAPLSKHPRGGIFLAVGARRRHEAGGIAPDRPRVRASGERHSPYPSAPKGGRACGCSRLSTRDLRSPARGHRRRPLAPTKSTPQDRARMGPGRSPPNKGGASRRAETSTRGPTLTSARRAPGQRATVMTTSPPRTLVDTRRSSHRATPPAILAHKALPYLVAASHRTSGSLAFRIAVAAVGRSFIALRTMTRCVSRRERVIGDEHSASSRW